MILTLGAVMLLAALVIVLFPLWRSYSSQATLDSNTANVARQAHATHPRVQRIEEMVSSGECKLGGG